MKISSEEMGKLFIAFGTALMQTTEQVPAAAPPAETIEGTFDLPTTEPDTPEVDTQGQIAALEQQLKNFHTQQNQSGLDLKPINI